MSTILIKPFNQGEKLQQQINEAKKSGNEHEFDIWWLGQSGFLVQWNKVCVLFDPYLSDFLTKKYAATSKPHVRMSELVIEPELLDCIDVVTSSHNHTDHLDADTLKPLLKVNPEIKFIIPEANRAFVSERVGCSQAFPIGLNDDEMTHIKGFDFYGVPAAHNQLERDEHGYCKYMGYVAKFGQWTLYHSGDTLWFDTMVETLKPFNVDIAFLPINGNEPSRGVAGNLNCEEAARLGKEIGARLVIPHHYDMFEFNTANPNDFKREAERYHLPYRVLQLGEHWNSKSLSSR